MRFWLISSVFAHRVGCSASVRHNAWSKALNDLISCARIEWPMGSGMAAPCAWLTLFHQSFAAGLPVPVTIPEPSGGASKEK